MVRLVDGGRLRQLERGRLRIELGEVHAVLARVQEDPGRRNHHRHVVLGFGRKLVVHVLFPEPAPAALREHACRTAFATVIGGQRQLDVAVEPGHALVEIRGTGFGGAACIEARVEAGAVRAQPETTPGSRHELHQPGRAGTRTGVHLAIGFLGHDAEQQRFGQAALLPFRPHHPAQVAVVLVAGQQRRAHVGEPAADTGLHRRVVLHHLVEIVALVVEQRGRTCGFWHAVVSRAQMVRVGLQQAVVVFRVFGGRGLGVGARLQQALVGGQLIGDQAAALLDAGVDDVFHVLQRGIAFGSALGVGVVHQHQRVAVALFGGGHAGIGAAAFSVSRLEMAWAAGTTDISATSARTGHGRKAK